MTVDEILASGQYTDGRGREWLYDGDFDIWVASVQTYENVTSIEGIIDPDHMRLLIERDQHECKGLSRCIDHPVPIVLVFEGYFGAQSAGPLDIDDLKRPMRETLAEAMDAARALAVGE